MATRKLTTSLLFAAAAVYSQTQLDLGQQAKNIDFSQATLTRPVRGGTSMPVTCAIGEMFYLTNGAPGRNSFVCAAPNSWTVIGGDIANEWEAQNGLIDNKLMTPKRTADAIRAQSAIPAVSGNSGSILAATSSAAAWTRQLTFTPASALVITSASSSISPARFFVQVSPTSNLTLTSAPTIPDGEDGQFLVITNVNAANSLVLQDEAVLAGSNLRFNGSNVTLAPRQSLYLVFSNTLSSWVRADSPGGGGGSTPGTVAGWDRQFSAARCQNTVAGAGFNLGLTGNAPVANCQTGANSIYATLDWDDTGTKPAYDFVTLPSDSVPTIRVDLGWSTTATSGNVSWQIATACAASNVDPAFGTNQVATSVATTTAGNLSVATLSELSIGSCGPGQQLKFRIQRDTTDSLTAPARLHYIRFHQ
jgi:hypothetical protein